MTSAELIRWSTRHDRRARAGAWWSSSAVIALIVGGALAGWVAWRGEASTTAASHAWLAGAVAAFAVAFMRVPFHLYWRADAPLLAQLPIEGGPLLDAALWRCARAAGATTVAVGIGALPLAAASTEVLVRHLTLALALGMSAAMFMPAIAIGAAALVAASQSERLTALRVAAGIDAAPGNRASPTGQLAPPAPSTAMLGALPGFAATVVIVGVLLIASWLTGGTPSAPAPIVLAAIAGTSVVAIVVTRATAPRVMGAILRDVSALDRQRLATLEIRPPTGLEQLIARAIGDAALPYAKDARLMRRRYPMAFALGALAFLVLAILGLSRPTDPTPWLVATLVGTTGYGIVLSGRLDRPPIELARLTHSLPIGAAAHARARLAWIAGWWATFVVVPGVFAGLRQPAPIEGLALVGAGSLLVLGTAAIRRYR